MACWCFVGALILLLDCGGTFHWMFAGKNLWIRSGVLFCLDGVVLDFCVWDVIVCFLRFMLKNVKEIWRNVLGCGGVLVGLGLANATEE